MLSGCDETAEDTILEKEQEEIGAEIVCELLLREEEAVGSLLSPTGFFCELQAKSGKTRIRINKKAACFANLNCFAPSC